MIKIAICDDEPYMAQEISRCLSQYMEEKGFTAYHAGLFLDGRSLIESGGGFDLVFLDIQMSQPDGMETAKLLRRQGNQSRIVFVTVLKEWVFDAFEVEACDYLLKPLDKDRFHRTMDRVLAAIARREAESLLIQRGAASLVIPLDQMVYCEVLGRKVYIHQKDGPTIDYYEKLDALEKRLDGRFFRCHRSYLVNLAYVRARDGGQAALSTGEKIPVSRLRGQDLTQALLRYMKERNSGHGSL